MADFEPNYELEEEGEGILREQNEHGVEYLEGEDEDEDGDGDGDYEEDEDDFDAEPHSALEIMPVVASPRVSQEPVTNLASATNVSEKEKVGSDKKGADETSLCDDQEWNRSEIDGLFCPICMEAWTNGGDHQVCCLPCGHIYGLSCIQKWIRQRRSSGKCPQCNKNCTLKDVRVLYASRIVVVDRELQKKVRALEAKCLTLETKHADCSKKEAEGKRIEADLRQQVHQFKERTSYLEGVLVKNQRGQAGPFTASVGCQGRNVPGITGYQFDSELGTRGYCSNFSFQKEFLVDGARFFDVDASRQFLILARRLAGMGGLHGLTKISLVAPHEREDIQLSANTKAVKDLRLSPHGRFALLALLGKKLSVVSTESNNAILSYDLPAAAWSCSWDMQTSNYVYTGLQNGMLLLFDMRQTRGPVETMAGLTSNPIHSLHPVPSKSAISSGVRTILTASAVGLCEWNFGGVEERPFLVPESENQGVCISLACSTSNDEIVASFRPKVEMRDEMIASQFPTPATSIMGHCVLGSHISYKRLSSHCYQKQGSTCANVDETRLPKSTVIDIGNNRSFFVSGDEVTSEIIIQELPSLMAVQHLNPRKLPIRDIKFARVGNSELLGCLCDDMLRFFSLKLL